jgi:uncharacterized protein YqgV (UPF0045/DUF77 family)
MPVPPAELTAEFSVETSPEGEKSPRDQIEAAREVAAASGLAQEAGPESTGLSGSRAEVLEALPRVVGASLEAGARAVHVRVELPLNSRRLAGLRNATRGRSSSRPPSGRLPSIS